ncbi:transcription-repair coupling factor [Saccharophagus degradans]|uniref:transcription-repair coupling factor n=1 Tax=Saccharophagus degradans TaxID=86304 RepID=UPI001C08ADF0|nr:transcription-repair coupling factor [Saccharophagus degradans]MBU2984214.1 transcription-repair coupling factor [Saccharophagus degradans]
MTSNMPLPLPSKLGDKKTWGGVSGLARVFACAEAAAQHNGTTVIIVQSMTEADRFARDLMLLTKGKKNTPEVLQFADWETLPYDNFSPHQDIISDRMRCLYQLSNQAQAIVVVAASTLMQRLAPANHIIANSLVVEKNETINRDNLLTSLINAGYQRVDTVFNHGEFAIRGALLDIFPMGSSAAYRIELFDDEVDSIRTFDPETQRTVDQVSKIELLPGKECQLDAEGISRFKLNWYENFNVDHRECPVFQDVSSGISPAGIEYYLPLFFEQTASLFDYLHENTLVMVTKGFETAVEDFWRDASSRFESHNIDMRRPLLPPAKVFHSVSEIYSQLKRFQRVVLEPTQVEERSGSANINTLSTPNLNIDAKAQNPLYKLEEFIYNYDGRILFCAESNGRRETLKEHFKKIDLQPEDVASPDAFLQGKSSIAICVADFQEGLRLTTPNICIIAESQLFGQRVQQYRRRKESNTDFNENIVKNLTELKIGAPVVHIEHGVGRYLGLQTIEFDGQKDEFLVLEYANEAKLYVPVANLHFISRYSGAEDSSAPLNRLGSDQWQKAKRKAAEKLRDVAAELLEIYAKRQAREGFQYTYPKDAYEIFTESFPFEETVDQQQAIDAVRQDMISAQPMDRLVCGDVGFGKTEVAMRAAFIAVQNSKQIAVLVPTTLLAQQHYENFKDRFADWPVNVEVISRFKSNKDITEIQKKLEAGKVDILIGTHKLIQGDLVFPNLGLLIIDEEHRFGVRQKEALKALRTEVDILTLTATPIPRTLNMAMSGIRDLSIIATPPAKRLSVKTFVRQSDTAVIKEAILREIMRGGQLYYLHNEVSTIEKTAADLQELVPEARIRVAHGQMRERELEAAMSDFYHKRHNILVCTTIIETGIDIPSANTIIIDRADKFGLAQLHQLRGRVGRSHHQAYAYLLTPHKKAMTADAVKRLEAIAEAQDLGAGFTLASHDLEIRGAGELLGDEQSGQMQAIGFSLYMEMLDKAVEALKSGKELDFESNFNNNVEFNLRIPALIPDDYLPDVHTRVILYKRMASVKNENELNDLQVEMIDRFGLLPDPIKNLVRQTRLRLTAEQLGVCKVEANNTGGRIEFTTKPNIDPLTIVKMVQTTPQHYRMEGASHLKFFFDMESADERLLTIHNIFETLMKSS